MLLPGSLHRPLTIRCRSKFAILLMHTKSIKPLTIWHYPAVQHVSSSMQSGSSPNDTSDNYPYQHHHQNSLSSTHSPNYLDHNGQPVGYYPVMQGPQVQRLTYGHPQDHHCMSPTDPNESPLT